MLKILFLNTGKPRTKNEEKPIPLKIHRFTGVASSSDSLNPDTKGIVVKLKNKPN